MWICTLKLLKCTTDVIDINDKEEQRANTVQEVASCVQFDDCDYYEQKWFIKSARRRELLHGKCGDVTAILL